MLFHAALILPFAKKLSLLAYAVLYCFNSSGVKARGGAGFIGSAVVFGSVYGSTGSGCGVAPGYCVPPVLGDAGGVAGGCCWWLCRCRWLLWWLC